MRVLFICALAITGSCTSAFAQTLPDSWTLSPTLNCGRFNVNLTLNKVADSLLLSGGPSGDEGSSGAGYVYRVNRTIDAVKTGEAQKDVGEFKFLSQRNTSSLSGTTIKLSDDSAYAQRGERGHVVRTYQFVVDPTNRTCRGSSHASGQGTSINCVVTSCSFQ